MGILYSSLIQRKNQVPRYLFSGVFVFFLMIKELIVPRDIMVEFYVNLS